MCVLYQIDPLQHHNQQFLGHEHIWFATFIVSTDYLRPAGIQSNNPLIRASFIERTEMHRTLNPMLATTRLSLIVSQVEALQRCKTPNSIFDE